MLISVHIPKCAGTSFRTVLETVYGDKLWGNYGTIFTRSHAKPGMTPQNAECVHGHFFADSFDDLFPERQLITWLRDPVERVISNYYHFLRSPDMRDDCCRTLFEQRLSLRKFAEMDWMRNQCSRYLAGKPLSDFAFVGIAERFTDSLALATDTFEWNCRVPIPRDNVNPIRRSPHYAVTPNDHAYLMELNELDAAYYVEATGRLNASLEKALVYAA